MGRVIRNQRKGRGSIFSQSFSTSKPNLETDDIHIAVEILETFSTLSHTIANL